MESGWYKQTRRFLIQHCGTSGRGEGSLMSAKGFFYFGVTTTLFSEIRTLLKLRQKSRKFSV